ncbi:MAG: sulfur carrier protein ThiS [Bacteroidales bacterium]
MNIILNNRPEEIDQENISIQGLIRLKNFTFKLLVTKLNGKLVRKTDRDTVFIKEGDNVAIIHLISGG